MLKRSLSVLGLVLLCTASFAQATPRTYAPVQDGFTPDAESVLPWAEGRVLVKFTAEALRESGLSDSRAKATGPVTATGLSSLDVVMGEMGVTDIRPAHRPVADKALAARLGIDQWFRVELPSDADVPAVAAHLAQDSALEFAQPDWRAFPAVAPNDPLYEDNWGHDNTAQLPGLDWGGTYSHTLPTTVGTVGFDTNADVAWNGSQGYGDSGVVIAILDSGVDTSHPDLNLTAGYDYGSGDSNPNDNSGQAGHGTACAGVAAAIANNNLGVVGVAGGCTIMPLKIANNAGSIYFSAVTNAIYHAADNGADVISMSFGAAITSSPATDAALNYANAQGVTLLAATGNENDNAISYPAYHAAVIGVGAASPCGDRKRSSSSSNDVNPGIYTDPNGYTCDGERWWGSNYGRNTQDHQGAVDILAPTILPTTDISGSGGYQSGDYEPFFNGTSCSTPYAAGVCALIISANPSFTPAQVRAQLVSTAQDVVNVESGAGWDRYSGYGMVDAAAAVGGGTPAAPVADFNVSSVSGCAPLSVNFSDQSIGTIDTWSWTFGDGGTSSAQDPAHTYNTPGVYSVSLTVTNLGGSDTSTLTGLITVDGPPVAGFTAAPTVITAGETVTFTDTSTNALSWSWTFGDGGTSTAQSPAHTYTVPGLYTVQLIASNGCGDDTALQTDLITVNAPPAPVAAFSASAASGCAPLSVDFSDESLGDIDTWAWTFGDGGTGDVPNPSHEYLTPGVYDVALTATGLGGADTQTMAGMITVGGPPTAAFTAAPTTITAGSTVTFTDTSTDVLSRAWSFGDGGTSVDQNPVHTYATAGLYTVRLIASNDCGSDTLIVADQVTVNPPAPVAGFTIDPADGCAPLDVTFTDASTGDITGWQWDFGDIGTDTAPSPNHQYTVAGNYDVRLIVTGPGGADTLAVADAVSVGGTVTAGFGVSDAVGTVPLAVTFTDQSLGTSTSWQWDFGDGNTSTEANPTHTFTIIGVWDVRLIVSNGCDSDTLLVANAVAVNGTSGTDPLLPARFGLEQNYPNPFNPMTTLSYSLEAEGQARLEVYDMSGRRVAVLVDAVRPAGRHELIWQPRELVSGIYFVKFTAHGLSETRRVTLLK